jgi:hypothetical protein
MSFFDICNNLTQSAEYIFKEELEGDYLPFMINRSMSNFYDVVMHANEMNVRGNLSKRQQYDYYHWVIQPKKKRFSKWYKPENDARVKTISEYYKCNIALAEQYSTLISDSDFEKIQDSLYKGGKVKK